jgi:hypothetical protein
MSKNRAGQPWVKPGHDGHHGEEVRLTIDLR